MKIILREHVENLGDRGDEVNVAPGYARNYLLPKGMAYPSGAGSAKQIADQQRTWAKREARSENAAQQLGAQVGALSLEARRRAGEGGTLYGSVTNSDIAAMIAEKGYDIDRRKIQVKEPIKSLGDFEVVVKLHRTVSATVKVSVLTEAGQTLAELQALRKELEPEVAKSEFEVDEDGEDKRGPKRAKKAEETPAEASEETAAETEQPDEGQEG